MDTKGAYAIFNVVSNLLGEIEKKVQNDSQTKHIEEIKSLRELCWSEDPVVSVTACQGILFLVQNGCLPISETISSLIASSELSSAKNVSGVINVVVNLMLLNIKSELSKKEEYTCPYNIRSYPVHPFIHVLNLRPHVWRDVLNHMDAICSHSDTRISSNSLKLLTPVFKYVMQYSEISEACRHHVWSLLINNFLESSIVLDIFITFLSWEKNRVLELNYYLTVLCEAVMNKQKKELEHIMPLFASVVIHSLLEAAYTPQSTLLLVKKLATSTVSNHSIILILLSHSITICPAVFLHHLLDLCLWLLQQGNCTLDATWMCVSALLPWLVVSPKQMQESLETATKIIALAQSATSNPSVLSPLFKNSFIPLVASANQRIIVSIQLARLCEILREDLNLTVQWLENINGEEIELLHLYACSLLIGRPMKDVRLAALNFLTKCPSKLAAHNLTVILYQLAREKESVLQLALLNALPSTAVDKDNIPVIISTIVTLRENQDKVLRLLAIQLSLKLWIVNERCYPVVIQALLQNTQELPESEAVEFSIVIAAACKEICNRTPEKHGKELVRPISDLLSRSGGYQGSLASALALDALVPLCKEHVADIHTVWRHLAPRLCKDKRPTVVSSFCNLVSYTATLPSSIPDADETLTSVVKWLWQNVASSPNALIVKSSLEALSKFKLDQMSLKCLPECFRRGLTLPPEMTKTPVDAARKPEDVLTYIPGNCWVQLLQQVHVDAREVAVKTIACWLREELASYRSGKYNLARGEPYNYKSLHEKSICRGLFEFIRTTPEVDVTVNLCLKVGSEPLPKPLPPLNWSFLNDFIDKKDKELTFNIIRLLAKQAQISQTGRKIMEAYLSSNLYSEKIEFLYSLLGDLGRGIPPNSLRPFLEQTIHSAFDKKDEKTLKMILRCIKDTLQNQKIHEANLVLLCQQIQTLWPLLDPQHPLLVEFLSCAGELPISYIETMSSISLMWEINSINLQKAIKFRAHMALIPDTPAPLVWLNEIIDAATTNITEQVLVLEVVNSLFRKLHSHHTAWDWLQELMGQIYKTINAHQAGSDFLVSVFIIAVNWISGYAILDLENVSDIDFNCLRFPQAIVELVKRHGDAKQMAEWLQFLQIQTDFNPRFIEVFQNAAKVVSIM